MWIITKQLAVGVIILICGIGGNLALPNGVFRFNIPVLFPNGIPAIVFAAILGIFVNSIFLIFKVPPSVAINNAFNHESCILGIGTFCDAHPFSIPWLYSLLEPFPAGLFLCVACLLINKQPSLKGRGLGEGKHVSLLHKRSAQILLCRFTARNNRFQKAHILRL